MSDSIYVLLVKYIRRICVLKIKIYNLPQVFRLQRYFINTDGFRER